MKSQRRGGQTKSTVPGQRRNGQGLVFSSPQTDGRSGKMTVNPKRDGWTSVMIDDHGYECLYTMVCST